MEQSSDSPPAATVNVGPEATHKAVSPSAGASVGAEREARLPATAELHTGSTDADPAVAGAPCRFCQIIAADDESLSIWSNTYVAAFEDAYPSAPGHMLVVPTRHVQYARDLCREEWTALMDMVHDLLIDEGDATIGINDGPAAGQTVPHLHVHVIPRSVGDVTDPRGGVRWVIPSTAAYWSPA